VTAVSSAPPPDPPDPPPNSPVLSKSVSLYGPPEPIKNIFDNLDLEAAIISSTSFFLKSLSSPLISGLNFNITSFLLISNGLLSLIFLKIKGAIGLFTIVSFLILDIPLFI